MKISFSYETTPGYIATIVSNAVVKPICGLEAPHDTRQKLPATSPRTAAPSLQIRRCQKLSPSPPLLQSNRRPAKDVKQPSWKFVFWECICRNFFVKNRRNVVPNRLGRRRRIEYANSSPKYRVVIVSNPLFETPKLFAVRVLIAKLQPRCPKTRLDGQISREAPRPYKDHRRPSRPNRANIRPASASTQVVSNRGPCKYPTNVRPTRCSGSNIATNVCGARLGLRAE